MLWRMSTKCTKLQCNRGDDGWRQALDLPAANASGRRYRLRVEVHDADLLPTACSTVPSRDSRAIKCDAPVAVARQLSPISVSWPPLPSRRGAAFGEKLPPTVTFSRQALSGSPEAN